MESERLSLGAGEHGRAPRVLAWDAAFAYHLGYWSCDLGNDLLQVAGVKLWQMDPSRYDEGDARGDTARNRTRLREVAHPRHPAIENSTLRASVTRLDASRISSETSSPAAS